MVPAFVARVNASKAALGMKHDRTGPPRRSHFKFKKRDGAIYQISIVLTKGEIMSHKGKGKYPDNRKPKPFYNPIAENFVPELADALATNTGNIICGNLCIR